MVNFCDRFESTLEGAEFAGDCAKVAVIREVALKLRALNYAPTVVGARQEDTWASGFEMVVQASESPSPPTARKVVFAFDL